VSLSGSGGVATTLVSPGAVDTLGFAAFCDHFLRPGLQAGDIVVLDTLGAQRARGSEETARAGKATVMWLPPYSPDFSPIEPRWAKWKTY
jgi:transposase